ncbi:LADA_0D12816g1_1 [Lachancea dasiensis]|uniref:LADA_0D12816g1_1 n=1 Tax=Lachancea dasiensis TaxID=1072105 RepID=A0A1G4J896_9SACH|nr:LADA_0D12816g1_1 [Lachancea dasiensis]
MGRKFKSKPSGRRAQNALEIAQREIDSSGDQEHGFSQDLRRNGTVVNPHRKSSDDEEEEFQDDEIDSDEALGSGDELDVLNSKFSQTLRDRKKLGKSHSDSEDEGYTSIDEDELMPLSAVWDLDTKDKDGAPHDSLKLDDNDHEDDMGVDASSEEASESEDEEEDEEDEEDPFDEVSDDDEDVELSNVTAKLRKDTEKAQYRKLNNAAVGEENEFALPSAGSTGQKLNLADMVAAIDDKEAVDKAGLIKSKTQTLNVPLPQRIQQRHDRRAAYEISKDEVNKWRDVVQQNRQAEHLSFPLNPQVQHNEGSMFTPSEKAVGTELEKKVESLLESSNLGNVQKESTFEEIATAKMSPDEMRKRTAELRLMRELMFREERKAKRIKKIKSKAYRRIKKKEMLKNKELLEESEDENTEDHDAARARERMSLKHKTSSKWAKDMVKHGMTKDKQTREEMEEMLRQGERLRAKIVGHQSGSESDSAVSDIEDDSKFQPNEDESQMRDKLGKTGILNMAFMKNAESRRAEENKQAIAHLRALEPGEDLSLNDTETNGVNVTLNAGRRIYAPGVEDNKSEVKDSDENMKQELEEDNANSLSERMKKGKRTSKLKKKKDQTDSGKKPSDSDDLEESNPWLDNSDDEQRTKKSTKVKVVDENSSKLTKSANKIAKERAKQDSKTLGKAASVGDPLLDVDTANKMQLVDPYSQGDEDIDGFMFKQQDVIAEAFAGDDVEDKFTQEKKRVAIDEDDKVEDVTLPGWGDWAGAGAAPTKKRKFKKVKGTVEKDKRRDKNLKNVIINEKVNKKNLKYQSSAVPFPFENKEQYERSLRMPLGQEWTSRSSHQRMIKPRILTKPGTVIDPLKAPFR